MLHNDLNVALPVRGNYLGYKQMFDRKLMKSALWEKANLKYDMFLVHTRWNHTKISQLLDDQGDVFYFSIVRDPVELFRSYWDYYNLTSLSNMTLETYTRTTIYKEVTYKNKTRRTRGYNTMLLDFGLNFQEVLNKSITDQDEASGVKLVKNKVQEINDNFDLILLADEDYFDDSIILLKNALCWSYEEMINLKLNSHSQMQSQLSSWGRKMIKGIFLFRYLTFYV